ELNISIDELARKSNVPKGTLSKITAGINTNPTLTTASALCKALECSIDDAFNFEKENTLSTSELDRIKKYRRLDTHGAKIVDLVLNEEYERCTQDTIETSKGAYKVARAAAFGGGTADIEIAADVSHDEINRMIDENKALQRRRKNEKVADELIDIATKDK
nr:helix-turn-helix transcriptional regulator [Oscillospiraceae bacterium]